MPASFSSRFRPELVEVAISVREDAPHELRHAVQTLAYRHGLYPSDLRDLLCDLLLIRPDWSNYSEYPNIDSEVRGLLGGANWYQVYDSIEGMYALIRLRDGAQSEAFAADINRYFIENGIGWKLDGGAIETRGAEAFEESVAAARDALDAASMPTASSEIHSALGCLSQRPDPDLTGAIHHAMGALECAARELTGDRKATLGEIIKRNPELLPRPLDEAVAKAWGYASERARHIREGETPERAEAELIVVVAAAVATYLAKKHAHAARR